MSRLIQWNLITLDGYFEGAKPWDLGFHESVWGEELEELSIEPMTGADGLVFGRAELSETLIREGLYDEYRLVVAPVIVGSGKPLFGCDVPGPKLELLSTQPVKTGGVIVRYAPAIGV